MIDYEIDDPSAGPLVLAAFQQEFSEPTPFEAKTLDEKEIALIEQIREAFQGVQLEDGIGLMQAEVKDDYACIEIQNFLAQHDEREDWSKLTASQLFACFCALSYVDAKGFRFLIPSFVIYSIMGQVEGEFTYYSLTCSQDENDKLKQYKVDQLSLLSDDQKDALQEYIRHERRKDNFWGGHVSFWDTPEDMAEINSHLNE